MYLTWPVSLAAKVLLLKIKNSAGNAELSGLPEQQNSILTSLRFLGSVLKELMVASAQFDDLLEDIWLVLESGPQSTLSRQDSSQLLSRSNSLTSIYF